MKQYVAPEILAEINHNILNEAEWQKWLTDYTTLRSEAFLKILQAKEKKNAS